jgi:hypothetical protein
MNLGNTTLVLSFLKRERDFAIVSERPIVIDRLRFPSFKKVKNGGKRS